MTLERSDSAHSCKYVRLGSDRAAGGTPRGGAPLVQSMVAEGEDIASSMQKLAEKQTQLEAAAAELAAKEVALCADMDTGTPGSCPTLGSLLVARWEALVQDKAQLTAQWQVLVEERRQLTAVAEMGKKKRYGAGMGDFEPGETPLRDVTCSVITHQLDTPFFSCCFQR